MAEESNSFRDQLLHTLVIGISHNITPTTDTKLLGEKVMTFLNEVCPDGKSPEPSTPKARVEAELSELLERYEKLTTFLNSSTSYVNQEQLFLMQEQANVMFQYIRILEERLKIWN